jgi:hypothetical protein
MRSCTDHRSMSAAGRRHRARQLAAPKALEIEAQLSQT